LNIGVVLLFLPLTSLLLTLATALAPAPADCLVILRTVFNLVGSLLLLPFTKQYAALIERIYPLKRA
jgi:phosphate:Na+ symporter